MAENEASEFARAGRALEASQELAAYATGRMLGEKPFTIANALFGASMRVIEQTDGPAAAVEFAKQALAALIAGETSSGREH